MASQTDSLTKVALRLRATDRAELAAVLARSVAAGEPPRPAPRLPALTLRQARVAAGLLLVVALGLSANYLGRLYTCAAGLSAAKEAMLVGFAMFAVAVFRVARLDELVTADALRLTLPDRQQLAESLRRSLDARDAERGASRPALSPAQFTVAAGTAVVLPAVGVIDYGLRLHSCAGGAVEAKQRIALLAVASAVACFMYVRGVLRDAEEYRTRVSVPEHS